MAEMAKEQKNSKNLMHVGNPNDELDVEFEDDFDSDYEDEFDDDFDDDYDED